jgi:hypothetical protein
VSASQEGCNLAEELLLQARLAGVARRVRSACRLAAPPIDADEHAALVAAEVERVHRRALSNFVRERTEDGGWL